MPNRVLRDGILTSERVNKLDWPAEVFYRRLMSVVDDFGRFFANPSLIRAACYPLQLDKVSDSDIGKWLLVTGKAGLVRVYPASDGKKYLELIDFRQHRRADKSKFPQPPPECSADAVHVQCTRSASAHVDVDVDVVEGVCEGEGDIASPDLQSGSAVELIPLVGQKQFAVDRTYLAELERAYPAVDGAATLREIRAWCLSNPAKCKTERGVRRFINRWFEKEQNHG
jgi:hypothetical protein